MRLTRWFCAAALCAIASACSWVRPEPSAVAQGQYYASGNPTFDEFFIKLHRFQVELAAAPDGPRRIRAELASSLGLGTDAGDEQIATRLGEEAHKLARAGVRMKLELPPEPTAGGSEEISATLRTSKTPEGDAEIFTSRVGTAATQLLRIRSRMRLGHQELERLRVQGIEIDGRVDAAFRKESPWKRDEVRENIADGQKLIALMIARSDEIEKESSRLLEAIVRAATTDDRLGADVAMPPAAATAPQETSEESAEDDKPKKTKQAKPRKGSKTTRPAPKPKAPPRDEARPPPPPKPAPAEATPREFEP